MSRVSWDVTGAFLIVRASEGGPRDEHDAKRMIDQIRLAARGRDLVPILLDGECFRGATLMWKLAWDRFVQEEGPRLRIAVHGTGAHLDGLQGIALATDLRLECFAKREDAAAWIAREAQSRPVAR